MTGAAADADAQPGPRELTFPPRTTAKLREKEALIGVLQREIAELTQATIEALGGDVSPRKDDLTWGVEDRADGTRSAIWGPRMRAIPTNIEELAPELIARVQAALGGGAPPGDERPAENADQG